MKRRYNTLNEEMNRMKSLFGESRLYGNLVDNEEKNILTEGYRFFDNLSDAFKLTFRSLDDLGKFTKFINVEINNVDDIVKHVRQFPGLWKTIAPGVKNWNAVLKNLEDLSGLQKSDKLKNIGTLDWYDSLAGYPQIGGMQDMIDDMWRVSKGKDSTFENLPAVIGTKKAVYDPEKGGIVIKTEKKMNNDILIDSEGNVIATMDDKGNWVNSKGEIIEKPKDSKVKTEPEEAEIVKTNGSKSSEEVDAILDTEMKKGDGLVITDKEVSGEELIQNQKELVEAQTELNRIKLELSRAETDQMRIKLEEKRIEAETEVKLKQEESQQIRDRQKNTSSEKTYVSTDEKGLGDMKTKDEDKLSGELGISKESGWWRRNVAPLYDWLYVLRRNEGDSRFIKNAKFFGSSLVDPIGMFRRFLPGESTEKFMSKGKMRIFRAAGGITTNLLTYNMLLYNLPMIFTDDCEWCDKFSLSNVWSTRWEYYKNWSPGAILFKGWAKNEKKSFCKKLYKGTGICCDDEMRDKKKDCLTYQDDFIQKIGDYVEDSFEGYKCEDFKKIMPNNTLSAEERKKIAKEIATNYNENMLENLGVSFTFDIAKALGLLNIELANVGDSILLNAKDEQGNNLLDYHLQQQKAKTCISELKPNELKEEEGTFFYLEDEID